MLIVLQVSFKTFPSVAFMGHGSQVAGFCGLLTFWLLTWLADDKAMVGTHERQTICGATAQWKQSTSQLNRPNPGDFLQKQLIVMKWSETF